MAENSKIEWTDHTFNPWIGCTKVSPGCANCYAENLMDTRYQRVKWGKGQPRVRTSVANWKEPLLWSELPIWQNGLGFRRPRVFCASLADWLDDEVPVEWLADVLLLAAKTESLDWLFLSKRPELWMPRIAAVRAWCSDIENQRINRDYRVLGSVLETWVNGVPPWHFWIGTTVEDQTRANERIPHLLRIPARVRFLSCEPLLGPVNIIDSMWNNPAMTAADMARYWKQYVGDPVAEADLMLGIHWVICGGESGPGARPMHPDWARSLRNQCKEARVPFLFKQWGGWLPCSAPVLESIDGRLVASESFSRNTRFIQDESQWFGHVGKAAAGRLLDGVEHTEFPAQEGVKP